MVGSGNLSRNLSEDVEKEEPRPFAVLRNRFLSLSHVSYSITNNQTAKSSHLISIANHWPTRLEAEQPCSEEKQRSEPQ